MVTTSSFKFKKEVQNSFRMTEDEEPIEAMEDIEMSIVSEEPIAAPATTEPDEILGIIDRMQCL